jgi:hypothetical protein
MDAFESGVLTHLQGCSFVEAIQDFVQYLDADAGAEVVQVFLDGWNA